MILMQTSLPRYSGVLVVTVLTVSVRVIFVTDGKLYFGQLPSGGDGRTEPGAA